MSQLTDLQTEFTVTCRDMDIVAATLQPNAVNYTHEEREEQFDYFMSLAFRADVLQTLIQVEMVY